MASILFQSSWTSIIFEGRNKIYGAYEIRQSYERNMLLGLFITCTALGAATFFTAWALNFSGQSTVLQPKLRETVIEIIMSEKIFTTPKQEFAKPAMHKAVKSFVPTSVQEPVVESKPLTTAEAVPDNNVLTGKAENPGEAPSGGNSGSDKVINTTPSVPEPEAKAEIGSFAPTMPVFEGSIQHYIVHNFNYPGEATRMGVDGKMVVEIILDEI